LKTSLRPGQTKNIIINDVADIDPVINSLTFMKKALFFLLLAGILQSCDKQRIYEEFIPVRDYTWNAGNILHFHTNMTDTAGSHNIYLIIRNTGKYRYSNLYLFVTAHSPDGNALRDTVEITLADEHGKWLGKGAASVYTRYHPYKSNIRFPVNGIYTFDVEQAMWIKDLTDITDVGLRIEKAVATR